MSSSLLPAVEPVKPMNNLDKPCSPLPIPQPEPWELPSVSLLQSPTYSTPNSSLRGPMTPTPFLSPSTPVLSTSTPKHEKQQGHQSRATATVSSTGVRLRRSGSIENIHRPRNYRSQLHVPSSKCDYRSRSPRSGVETEAFVHSLPTKVNLEERRPKLKAVEASGDGLGDIIDDSGTDDEETTELDDSLNSEDKSLTVVQMHRLQREHKMLYASLDHGRKSLIVRKALNAFMYGALRKQSESVHLLEMRVKMKSEECAARLILHNLLINLHRRTKQELETANTENVQRNKSIENLCLQLRVVRHLQATEKEKIIEKGHEINTLKSELLLLRDEHERSQQKLHALEKQLYEEQSNNEKLSKEKFQIQDELRVSQEKIDLLNECLKLEKKQAGKYLETSKQLKRQISEAKQQIKDLMYQSTHWQERARSYESENFELELHVKSGDKGYDELKRAFDDLLEENRILVSERESLLSHKSLVEAKLEQTNNESMVVKRDLTLAKEELEKQKLTALELENVLRRCRDENLAIQAELFSYRVAHVRKRRVWVQVLMSIINPLEIIRLLVCGGPTHTAEVLPSSEMPTSEMPAASATEPTCVN